MYVLDQACHLQVNELLIDHEATNEAVKRTIGEQLSVQLTL